MLSIVDFALHSLVNAVWQIAAVVIGASILARFLRNAAPGYRHTLWVTALVLSLALPLWGLLNLQRDEPHITTGRPAVADLSARENLSSTPTPSPSSPVSVTAEATGLGLEGLLQALRRPVVAPSGLGLGLALAY